MNQAGGDHGAAIPGRIAHFLDIIANELPGGLGMSGINLAHVVHEDLWIDQRQRRHFEAHEACDVGDEGVAVI